MVVWGDEPMVYMRRSLGGSCSGTLWTMAVSWSQKSLGVVQLLCSDTLHVRLCRLGPVYPRWTFWSLLGDEGGRLQGLTRRLGSSPAPGGRGKLVFLCHAPCVTQSRKWPVGPPPGWRLGSPKSRWLGACLLAHGPWLASQAGQEPRPELGHVID
jgi:hypothetical protein